MSAPHAPQTRYNRAATFDSKTIPPYLKTSPRREYAAPLTVPTFAAGILKRSTADVRALDDPPRPLLDP